MDGCLVAERRLLDAAEAAEYLGLSETALRSKVQRREIPFVRVGKRQLRFDIRQLERWIEERTIGDGSA